MQTSIERYLFFQFFSSFLSRTRKMNCFKVHHRLLLIFLFFIISTLDKTKVSCRSSPPPPRPSPNLLPVSVPFQEAVPEPKKYLTLSSLFRSLIQVQGQVGALPLPQANIEVHPRRRPHVEVPLSIQSDAPGSAPSPTFRPVDSPINAEPEMSPTSPPFPSLIQVGDPPSPQTDSEGRHGRGSHGKVPLSHQLDVPAEVPTSSPGPYPILQPVTSPVSAAPEMSPTFPPLPSLIQVGATPSPEDGSQGRPQNSHRKVPLLLRSYAPTSSPGPGPSPTLQPVSSPINPEPALPPKSSPSPSPLPASPSMGSNEHPEELLSLRSRTPTSSPGSGPSPPVSSHINQEPALSPKSSPSPLPASPSRVSEESPEGPDGDRSRETPSDEPESDATEREEEEIEMDYSNSEQETGNAIVDVKKVCETTDYPSLCTKTVAPLVNSKNAVSLDSVLAASIDATDDLAKAAQLETRKLANAPGTPPELASAFEVCDESYGEALNNFDKAKEAYDTQDVGTMKTMLSAVITDIEDCNTEFSSLNIPSPVAEFSDTLRNMTSNCLAIVSLLSN